MAGYKTGVQLRGPYKVRSSFKKKHTIYWRVDLVSFDKRDRRGDPAVKYVWFAKKEEAEAYAKR